METRRYCAVPHVTPKVLSPGMNPKRAELIHTLSKKWVNGTTLTYYFFDREEDGGYLEDSREWKPWKGTLGQQNKVREGFEHWKNIGIGLNFKEVFAREEADIRIGFMEDDGSWSYVGRDIKNQGVNERTMNFGWNVDTDDQYNGMDTVIHEIGHTIGFEHEHQNYNAGIVWDEEAVYRYFEGYPNYWKREKTFENVIKKLSPIASKGTNWDPDSIMEYAFESHLIRKPQEYYEKGLTPAGGLSDIDISYARTLYPLQQGARIKLVPLNSFTLEIQNSEQQDFEFEPIEDGYYTIQTFGNIDSVLVLFSEDKHGELKYLSANDNGGVDSAAKVKWKMFKGRKYVVKLRLYYKNPGEKAAIMIWK